MNLKAPLAGVHNWPPAIQRRARELGLIRAEQMAGSKEIYAPKLAALEKELRRRSLCPIIVTGHTGWTDSLDFAFAHCDKVCNAWRRQKPHDSDAPWDGCDKSDDTEEKARSIRLQKQNRK